VGVGVTLLALVQMHVGMRVSVTVRVHRSVRVYMLVGVEVLVTVGMGGLVAGLQIVEMIVDVSSFRLRIVAVGVHRSVLVQVFVFMTVTGLVVDVHGVSFICYL
jgi:hypothetical protein